MTALIVTGVVGIFVSIIGGIAGFVKLMEFIQNSAKALARVEQLEDRLSEVEGKVKELEAEKSSLTEQNKILLHQNNELHLQNQELTKQNGYLLGLLGSDDSEEEADEGA